MGHPATLEAANGTPTVTIGPAVPSTATATVASGVIGTLSAGPMVAQTPSTFWSLVIQANCARCVASDPALGTFLNQTPFVWFRYSAMSDQCNLTSNVVYGDNGRVTGHCGISASAFQQWCNSRTPHCRSIFDLPAENNNSAQVASIAKYIVRTVGFQPDFWSIGNEPSAWKHYGIPWTHWSTSDHSTPTPLAYAFDVKAAIASVMAVDPGARFIGVQAACECNTVWFQDTVHINGPRLSAIAYHTYPASHGSTQVSLQQFYDPLASRSNITSSYASVRSAIRGYCSSCGTLPILVDEFNAGPGRGPSNHAGSYANAVFLAASVVQALRANVSQLSVFDLQTYSPSTYGFSMMNARDTVGPTGHLFSGLLAHLVRGEVYSAPIRTTVPSVWSVLTDDGTTQTLLVVNANLTHSLSLRLGGVLRTTGAADLYRWAPGANTPTATLGVPIATSYTVPAQGMLLLKVPIKGSGPPGIAASATGVPAGGAPPLAVQFTGNVSGGTAPYGYRWDFGDGTSSQSPNASHSYATSGSYTATLTVTGSNGGVARSSVTTDVAKPLTLALQADVMNGSIPLCVSFRASAGGGIAPYSIHWNFGVGGKTAQGASPAHCFGSAGVFRVLVTVVDATGDSQAASLSIRASSVSGSSGWRGIWVPINSLVGDWGFSLAGHPGSSAGPRGEPAGSPPPVVRCAALGFALGEAREST